jgi:AraC-like DNA-binding protein
MAYQSMPIRTAPSHVSQVRAAALTDYVPLARAVGVDGPALLREFGIDAALLAGPDDPVPASAVSGLLTETARRSGCETFALLLAERRSFSSLGPLSLLLRHESSLRTVIARLIGYQRLVSDILELSLEERGDEARILVEVRAEVAARQCVELVMALTCRFLGGAMFGGWHPAEAHFRYPPPADAQDHQRTFRAPLFFDRGFNGFVVPVESLDRPNAYGDPGFVEHARSYVDLLVGELAPPGLADQVAASIRRLLPKGAATLPRVAAELGMHPRALQRRLAGSGLVFADLVETIRTNLAHDLLANTNLPLSEIALLLGYASSASFSRWFAASAGEPPREWRLHHRARAAA